MADANIPADSQGVGPRKIIPDNDNVEGDQNGRQVDVDGNSNKTIDLGEIKDGETKEINLKIKFPTKFSTTDNGKDKSQKEARSFANNTPNHTSDKNNPKTNNDLNKPSGEGAGDKNKAEAEIPNNEKN